MRILIAALIVIVSLINLAPVTGALSADRLEALYGLEIGDDSLLVLLRHRAVLFGIVGGLLLASAFRPTLRPVAFTAGWISMLSFVLFAWSVAGPNAQIERVAAIDVFASILLAAALVLDRVAARGAPVPTA